METIENLIVELTTLCNLRCIHCGYRMLQPSCVIEKKRFVSIVNRLANYGLQTVMLTGGEPTLYPELLQIVQFCKQNHLRVKIATNGSNTTPILTLLQEDLLDELVISVDAVTEETYLSIRGRDMLHQIYGFIEQHPQFSDRIHLSYLVQKKNYKELIPFLRRANALNITRVSLLAPHYNNDFTSLLNQKKYRSDLFLSDEESMELQQIVAPQLKSFYFNNKEMFTCSSKHIDALIDYLCNPDDKYSFRVTTCAFPLKSVFLYADGSVSLCPYYPNWKTDLDSFLSSIKASRVHCIFEGKEKDSYCRRCLEVPL